MAISEAARSDLYTGLSEVIGPERAELLMNAIPIHNLDEVATKRDTATLKAELKADIAELETRIAQLETRVMATINAESAALRKSFTNWMLTLLVAIIGAMIGVGLLT